MTRAELEAVIWQHWPTLAVTDTAAVDAILAAADAYAQRGRARDRTPAEIADAAALRRLRPAPVVHWQKPGAPPNTPVCHGRQSCGHVTSRREAVSCGTCKQSHGWRAPLAVAS
jgi:hypothetical protein